MKPRADLFVYCFLQKAFFSFKVTEPELNDLFARCENINIIVDINIHVITLREC